MRQKQKRQSSKNADGINIFDKVYVIVSQIPKGKVATYGEIGRYLGVSARIVGWALHANTDPEHIPCHRVVNKRGLLALGYAFGGPDEQKCKLLKEGVNVEGGAVDLEKYLWSVKI